MGFYQQFIQWVIYHGGLYVVLLIIFAETGLFAGFFLPRDSLLFTTGIYINEVASNFFNVHYDPSIFFNFHYVIIALFIIVASFAGNVAGYWFGYKTGSVMFKWKDGFIFKRKYLLQAKEFYQHYGNGTIFFAKFLRIIRTFAPLVAGIVQMPKKNFGLYNIAGSICWVTLMILGGHFLQSWIDKKFGFSLKYHLGLITIIIVLITTLPILYKFIFRKKKKMLNPALNMRSDNVYRRKPVSSDFPQIQGTALYNNLKQIKMKNIKTLMMLVFAAGITLSACTQKMDASKVPSAVKTSFAKDFPGTSPKWEKEAPNFEANFTMNGETMSALYDGNGSRQESETDIKVADLPASVKDYIAQNYKGEEIKEGAIITKANGEVNYEAEVKGMDLLFTKEGKFIKTAKD